MWQEARDEDIRGRVRNATGGVSSNSKEINAEKKQKKKTNALKIPCRNIAGICRVSNICMCGGLNACVGLIIIFFVPFSSSSHPFLTELKSPTAKAN